MIDYHVRAMSSHLIEAREQLSFDWKKFRQQKGMIDYLFIKKQNNSHIDQPKLVELCQEHNKVSQHFYNG